MRAARYLMQTASRATVVSGIQCTGVPHLGNYFGAIQQWTRLQQDDSADLFFSAVGMDVSCLVQPFPNQLTMIADLHTLTVPSSPERLRENIFKTLTSLLACGIDPNKATLFQQSTVQALLAASLAFMPHLAQVAEHSELAWILGCYVPTGEMKRMTQWKVSS